MEKFARPRARAISVPPSTGIALAGSKSRLSHSSPTNRVGSAFGKQSLPTRLDVVSSEEMQ